MNPLASDKASWLAPTGKWFNIAITLQRYKGMIMRGDPDSGSFPEERRRGASGSHSFKDQEREAHRGEPVHNLADAQVVTSETKANPFMHKVLLDIDVPAFLIPSTTPGHSHLYIDVEVPWEKYVDMMDALAEAGVIEKGFAKAARARGFSTLRTPWTKKEEKKKVRPADINPSAFGDRQINPAWPPLSEEERNAYSHPSFDSAHFRPGDDGEVPEDAAVVFANVLTTSPLNDLF